MSQYGEPWEAHSIIVKASVDPAQEGDLLYLITGDDSVHIADIRTVNDPGAFAERIVACVNACRNLPDDQIAKAASGNGLLIFVDRLIAKCP